MLSNTTSSKQSDIVRKTPTKKHHSNTAGDRKALKFIKTDKPTPMQPKKHPKTKEQAPSKTISNDHLILLPSSLASVFIIPIATRVFTLLIIQRVSSFEAMITTTIEAATKMATIFGKSNNDKKTELFLAKL